MAKFVEAILEGSSRVRFGSALSAGLSRVAACRTGDRVPDASGAGPPASDP